MLADHIAVSQRYARSANLERDAARLEPLEGYVVTARALDVLDRIATVAAEGTAGGAWSLTGPYGSGKSSLALLLGAAFGPEGAARSQALRLIDGASGQIRQKIERAHKRHGTMQSGFRVGLATGALEGINSTVSRALSSAASESTPVDTRGSALNPANFSNRETPPPANSSI